MEPGTKFRLTQQSYKKMLNHKIKRGRGHNINNRNEIFSKTWMDKTLQLYNFIHPKLSLPQIEQPQKSSKRKDERNKLYFLIFRIWVATQKPFKEIFPHTSSYLQPLSSLSVLIT